jgi:hypothetical protein
MLAATLYQGNPVKKNKVFSSSCVLCAQCCQCLLIVHCFLLIVPSVFSNGYLINRDGISATDDEEYFTFVAITIT